MRKRAQRRASLRRTHPPGTGPASPHIVRASAFTSKGRRRGPSEPADDLRVSSAFALCDAFRGGVERPDRSSTFGNGGSRVETAIEGTSAVVAHGHWPGIRARRKHRARPLRNAPERTGLPKRPRVTRGGTNASISHPCSMKVPRARRAIHNRTPTSPARDRRPVGHRPSHIGCTHSFRTNGGLYGRQDRSAENAATRRMGAATTSRSVRRSGSVGSVRSLRAAMVGPAAAQASAQSPPGPSGACKHRPLIGPALAAACCSARQQATTRIRSAPAIAQTRAPGPRPAARLRRTRHRRQIRPATLFPKSAKQ
jgi:hypothetical protein